MIADFGEWLEARGRAKKTRSTYKEAAEALAGFTAAKGMPLLEGLRREHIEDYLAALRRKGNSSATIRNRQASLRALFNWLIVEDLRKDHPFERIPLEKLPDKVLPHYEPQDVIALLGAIAERSRNTLDLRDRAIILFLFDTGVRAQELCDITAADVARDGRVVTIPSGKGDKGRKVRYSPETGLSVTRYIRSRGGWDALSPADPLFADRRGDEMTTNTVRMMMQRRCAQAGVAFRGIHAWRRAFGIAFLVNGGDPLNLKELAGWNTYSMVYKYTKAAERERALDAHEEHSPVARLMRKGKGR
jgi:site-specific recombinase XerD